MTNKWLEKNNVSVNKKRKAHTYTLYGKRKMSVCVCVCSFSINSLNERRKHVVVIISSTK